MEYLCLKYGFDKWLCPPSNVYFDCKDCTYSLLITEFSNLYYKMTKKECNLFITCVEHRLRYLRKSLLGNLTADSRQSKNDELNDLLPLERKLKDFLKRFPDKVSLY